MITFGNAKILFDGRELGETVEVKINKESEQSEKLIFDGSFSMHAEMDLKDWPKLGSFRNVSIDFDTLIRVISAKQRLRQFMYCCEEELGND